METHDKLWIPEIKYWDTSICIIMDLYNWFSPTIFILCGYWAVLTIMLHIWFMWTNITETEMSSFDKIFINGCTWSCQNDNFQCSQWWKFHQNDDISVSVITWAFTHLTRSGSETLHVITSSEALVFVCVAKRLRWAGYVFIILLKEPQMIWYTGSFFSSC